MNDFSKDSILERVNRVSRENGHGDMSSVIFNTWYGINHRGTGQPAPTNADQHGLTFFTRPNLNLSYDNIKTERIFLPLLDKRGSGVNSIFTAIRLLLDRHAFNEGGPTNPIKSNLIDNNNPFICLLTNNLLSMSGWQDIVLDTYTSKEGRARESWSMGDGKTRNFQTTGITASFRNMIGDPITLLFFYWVHYISLVYEGKITPKPESIIENEIDYMTRFYRLVLDPTRTYVRKISCCGAAFPTSCPIGASHNFSVDSPYNMENKDISINFQMIGIDYLDPIVVNEFNTVVDMFTGGITSNGKYVRLAAKNQQGVIANPEELNLMNYRGIPRINPITYELEWYVEREVYNRELNAGKQTLNAKSEPQQLSAMNTVKSGYTDPFQVPGGYINGSDPLNNLEGTNQVINTPANNIA